MAKSGKIGRSLHGDRQAVPLYVQVANVLRTRILSHDDRRPLALEREYDLCRIHGVARMTVSKALDLLEAEGLIVRVRRRGTQSVPEAVRRLKRSLETHAIHVVTTWKDVTSDPSAYFGRIYQGVLEAARTAGYLLRIQGLPVDQASLPEDDFDLPDPSTVLGVILLGLMCEPLIRLFAQQPYPVVCVDYWPSYPQVDAVVVDCFSEGQQAAEYLLRHGHSDLFYLGNEQANGQKEADAELMLAGIQRALQLAGRPVLPPGRVRFCQSLADHPADETLDWLVGLHPRPTAGIVFDCDALENLAEPLKRRGISCPKDLSLIGKAYEGQSAEMTAMVSNPRAIGELAVECILQRSCGRRHYPMRLAVPSRLHLGSTVTYRIPV